MPDVVPDFIPDPPKPKTDVGGAFLARAASKVPVLGAGFNERVAGAGTPDPAGTPWTERRHMEFDIPGVGPWLQRAETAAGLIQPGMTRPQELAAQEALMAERAREHPVATVAGDIVGPMAGYAVLPQASMASLPAAMATSAAIEAADKAARGGNAREVLGAGAGGAVGGGVGYGLGKAANYGLGKLADRLAIRAQGGTTSPNFKDIAHAVKRLELEPGDYAALARERGTAGGLKSLSRVSQRAGEEADKVSGLYGNLVDQATEAGSRIPIDEALGAIGKTSSKGIQDKYIEKAIEEAKDELVKAAGPEGAITHRQLADWLAKRTEVNGGIQRAIDLGQNVSGADRAFNRVYNAGRNFQDEALGRVFEGGGDEARLLRRLIHLNRTVEGVARNRSEMLASQAHVGLLGTLGALSGAGMALENPKAGVPLLAYSLLARPLRQPMANVLTSAASLTQQGVKRATEAGVPQLLGARLGAELAQPGEPDFIPDKPPARVLVKSIPRKETK